MSGILRKLKGKSLFEELSERFPIKVVNPYGQVVVIPSNQFKNEWKEKLEAEGFETFASSYGRQTCFFLRKKKQGQAIEKSPVEGDSKPSPVKEKKPLKPEQRATIKQLYSQGLSGKEIANKLGCSIQTIGGVIRHLPKPKKPQEKHEEPKANSNDPDIVKELLSACSLLYPSHPKVCVFLLKEASNKILESAA